MFNVVLVSSREYLKYAAVVITSIVHNTDKSKSFKDFFNENLPCMKNLSLEDSINNTGGGGGRGEQQPLESKDEILTYRTLNYDNLSEYEKQEGYIFHIFTKDLNTDSNTKDPTLESNMQTLQNELSKIYPCEIKVHYINDALFANYKEWSGAYAVYYRLRVAEILDSNIKYVLSLECDMVVVGDIRGLFSIDMESKLAYVVHDFFFQTKRKPPHKKDASKFLTYDKHYFNAGFIFFNLESCRGINIWQQAMQLFDNYITEFAEQDVFNYILKGRVGILSPCFNYLSYIYGCYPVTIAKDDDEDNCQVYYTKKQLECGLKHIVIYHFTPYKPWGFSSEVSLRYNHPQVLKALQSWEKIAKITPVYAGELQEVIYSMRENDIRNYQTFVAERLENIESKIESVNKAYPLSIRALRKKVGKRINILIAGEIILLILILVALIK